MLLFMRQKQRAQARLRRSRARDWIVKTISNNAWLRGSAALQALACASAGFAALAAPAFAQDTPAGTVAEEPEATIIVTGSILRQDVNATPSPITVLTAQNLEQRGIQTTQEALQRISSNNGAALTNSFSANGAFAAGASAISLRGLTTSSTLVLFDGQRAAYYPLADDATRNFVDLNTIPDDIVDRIEVLRDGASSTYGADAIAGVVNVITKKQFKGLSGRVEAGITERGDAENYRISLTAGTGDLGRDGYNIYASGFWYRQNALYNRDLPYPYNSQDQSGICRGTECGPQVGPNSGSINPTSTGYEGFPLTSDRRLFATTFFVAPYAPGSTAAASPALGRWQILNPAAGCIAGETPYTLTPTEFADNPESPATVCQGDLVTQYGVVSPRIERFGGSLKATVAITDDIEASFTGNFLQSKVSYSGEPATIRANGPAGIAFPRFSTYTSGPPNAAGSFALALPVYVCPLVNGLPQATCDATNGTLNPNNPFAAQGQVARIVGRIPNLLEYNETLSRTYRGAFSIAGPITDNWNFAADIVGMRTDLTRTSNGYVYIQRLLNVVADGSYNFVDPLSNSQSVLDYLSPDNVTKSSSELYGAQLSFNGTLFELPAGPVQLGFGGQIRLEAINAPSANADFAGPTERYFVLNAFGTKGERVVKSGFVELNVPAFEGFEVNASGRYDSYNSGQDAFSPKVGFRYQPIDALTLRGTWSRGFRIPSFAEANALPTTGFVNNTAQIFSDAFLAQYGCTVATYNSCPTYIRSGSYGQTQLASPDLEPEKSTSWTAGVTFEPTRNIRLSVDYYNIKKKGAIIPASFGVALDAYYNGQAIPAGYTIIPDSPDAAFPNALPRVAYVQAPLINATTVRSEGLDFAATGRFNITDDLRLTSSLEATYIINLDTSFPDGHVESYEGTAGNFNLTAGSGTPEWHGSWTNTLEWKRWTISATAEFFGGYNLSAADQGNEPGDCGLLSAPFVKCDVDDYITVDLTTSYKLNDNFTLYLNVLNVFDDLPPIDPVTYGANNYNPVQGGTGIYGRAYRLGVKANF